VIPIGLRTAVRHLTVLPVAWDAAEEHAQARSVAWFPWVGLIIGALVYATLQLPLPILPRAALALGVWIMLSGGLHEDAVMDCADAAVAPLSAERRRAILADPHTGAHAVTVSGLLLIARFAALANGPAAAALVAPIAGRWSMSLTLTTGRGAHAPGLGARFAEAAPRWWPSINAIVILAAVVWITGWPTGLSALLGTGAGWSAGHVLASRLGAFNGDVHGAAGVIAETCTLYVCLAIQS
jgi:adenosylcobinamide-GDP ribazoletransferase